MALLELWRDSRGSSRVEMGMSGKVFSCSKGVKDPFEVQEGRCDFSRDTTAEMGLIRPRGENILVFLKLWQVSLQLRRGPQGTSRVAPGKASLHESCKEPLGIPLHSLPSPKFSSGAAIT